MTRSFGRRTEGINMIRFRESGEQLIGERGITPSGAADDLLTESVLLLSRRARAFFRVVFDARRRDERFFKEPTGERFIHRPQSVGEFRLHARLGLR